MTLGPRPESTPEKGVDYPTTLLQQAEAILTAPWRGFGMHQPDWGWGRVWVVVSLAGVLFGLVYVARVDLVAVIKAEKEYVLDNMPAAKRAEMAKSEEKTEQMEKLFRFQAFFRKVWLFAGPPLAGLAGVVLMGGLIWFVTWRLSSEPPDLLRSLSVAAFASLANALQYAALGLAVLVAAPAYPSTSPAVLTDPFVQPLAYAGLSRLDPFLMVYYVLLAAGLEASCRLSRRRAILVAVFLYGLATLAALGSGAASAAQMGG